MYQSHTAIESIVQQPEQFTNLLKEASEQTRWITLIDPPNRLNQKHLIDSGINVKKLRFIYTRNRHQWLKTVSTCVCNGLNSVVVAWPEPSVSHATVKALGEACQHGKSFCLLLGNRQSAKVSTKALKPEEQLQLAL